jgi:hypothetical protein
MILAEANLRYIAYYVAGMVIRLGILTFFAYGITHITEGGSHWYWYALGVYAYLEIFLFVIHLRTIRRYRDMDELYELYLGGGATEEEIHIN